MKNYFETLAQSIFKSLKPNEHLSINLNGDDTQFVRVNSAKVRQAGVVENYFLSFTFVIGNDNKALKSGGAQVTLTLDAAEDLRRVNHWLNRFRAELPGFPIDPYAELPTATVESSSHETKGTLIPRGQVADDLLSTVQSVDIAGIYAAGSVVRAMANSAGLMHWFTTESFSFDYSLFTDGQKALKSGYAGTTWDQTRYTTDLQNSVEKLARLRIPSRKLERGDYRVYLAPAAFDDLVQMLSWGGVSEMAIQKSLSPLRYLRHGEKTLSPKFTLTEDFSSGLVPRFNEKGDLAPIKLPLIEKGKLVSSLVSARSAKEFNIPSNGASSSEGLRSPVVQKGTLKESEILAKLGTGLYLSNLHYLNWSDQVNGRITGMTRYACFWVENGKIICPIENLRFDETIFDVFGDALEELTDFDEYQAVTGTYFNRQIGGSRTPGALLSKMHFSL
jgi:predicted Zn-dependent protease